MTKTKLHPTVLEFRGAMGDMVFRKRNGKLHVSMKPDMSGKEPTQAQAQQRVRFKQAVRYSQAVLADPATRAIYESASQQKGIPAFALGVADFLKLPSIDEVDLSAYQGQVGNPITIIASDDFGVVNVHVKLTDAQGATIENGDAITYSEASGHWTYTATAAVPAGTIVGVSVIAEDRPGGVASAESTKTV